MDHYFVAFKATCVDLFCSSLTLVFSAFWSSSRRTAACRSHNSIILTNVCYFLDVNIITIVLPSFLLVLTFTNRWMLLNSPFFWCGGGFNSTNVALMEMQNICCYLSDFLLDIKTIWGYDLSVEGIYLKCPHPHQKTPPPHTNKGKQIKKTWKVHFNNRLLRTGFVVLFQNKFVIPKRNVSASWLREFKKAFWPKKTRSREISRITINWAITLRTFLFQTHKVSSVKLSLEGPADENVTSAARDEILRMWSDV